MYPLQSFVMLLHACIILSQRYMCNIQVGVNAFLFYHKDRNSGQDRWVVGPSAEKGAILDGKQQVMHWRMYTTKHVNNAKEEAETIGFTQYLMRVLVCPSNPPLHLHTHTRISLQSQSHARRRRKRMVEAVGQEGFWCHNPRSEGWVLPEEESADVEGGDAMDAGSDDSSGSDGEWEEPPFSPRAQLQVGDDGDGDASRKGWSRWDGKQYASDETMRLFPKGMLLLHCLKIASLVYLCICMCIQVVCM